MARVFLTAIAPILVVAAVGYLLARLRLVEDPRPLSRVATYALLPALAFSALARSELSGAHIVALAICAWLVAALQSALGWALSRSLAFDSVTTSAFLLCVITVNAGSYGIPLNQFAFGPQTVGMATVYYVATLLVTYGGSVLVGAPSLKAFRDVGGQLLRMPIVYAACAGFALRQSHFVVPDELWRPVNLMAAGAAPMMLTVLGIELARTHLGGQRAALSWVFALRLVVAPVVALGVAWALGFEGPARNVAILQSSMPTAIGAALVAVEFNVRPAFVSGAILVTTLGSAVTLTLLLLVLGG
jgi:malate permease and related proteins